MNRTIIAVYGRAREGKSTTVKRVCQMLIANNARAIPSNSSIDYSLDILVTVQIGNVKIGLESQGDPKGRMFETVEKLAKDNCDIIVCTTRTHGNTVGNIDKVANGYGYHTLWISSSYSPKLDNVVLNHLAAEHIVEIIGNIIQGNI